MFEFLWKKKESVVVDSNPLVLPSFSSDSVKTITQSYQMTVLKQAALRFRNGASIFGPGESPEYSLTDSAKIEDVESYVRQAIKKKAALATKAGFGFAGRNKRTVTYINKRIAQLSALSGKPFKVFIRELFRCFLRDHNAFIVLARSEDNSGGIKSKIRNSSKQPISGIFIAHPSTMYPKIDNNGEIVLWIQMTPDGRRKEFPVTDVFHFYFDRDPGFLFGKPGLVPVYDDIRALRRIEEYSEIIIYKHAFPLIQYIVGTESKPATLIPGTDKREIDVVKAEIERMPPEALFVTPERHKIEVFGAKNFAMDLLPQLEYYKKRMFSGLGVSSVDMGEADTSNKATADNMSRAMVDDVKDYQLIFAEFMTYYLVTELLLESGFARQGGDILSEENMVNFRFEEIDLEAQIKVENHKLNMYQGNGITESEFRAETGRDPIDDTEREGMFVNLVTAKEAEYKAKFSSKEGSVSSVNQPSNQHGKRSGPRLTKPNSVSGLSLDFSNTSEYREVLDRLFLTFSKELKKLEIRLDNSEKNHYICNNSVLAQIQAAKNLASMDSFSIIDANISIYRSKIKALRTQAELSIEVILRKVQ
jgi:hypothetical protein